MCCVCGGVFFSVTLVLWNAQFQTAIGNSAVYVNDHRAARLGQDSRNLGGTMKRRMGNHDKADTHAQLPADIRPSNSSCRQLMYFSLQSQDMSCWLARPD